MRLKRSKQWNRGQIIFLGISLVLGIFWGWNANADEETVDLRGYGKVTATITPQRSEFVCETDQKADILLGKFLADAFWDAGTALSEKMIGIGGGKEIPVHLYPPYGAMIVARNKNQVLILGGKDEAEILSLAQKESLLAQPETLFKPAEPYPKYLDYYDLRSVKAYTMGLNPENKYRYQERADFVREFCPGGGGLFIHASGPSFGATPAEGIFPEYPQLDTDFALAEKEDQLYSVDISTGTWPDWAQKKWPNYIDLQSPISALTDEALDRPESFGLSLEQREETCLKFVKDVMLRYKDNPSMGGWQLFGGDFVHESYWIRDKIQGHCGYTPAGMEGFRRWLQEVRGYSLKDLGERWYGDAGHFHQWSEVSVTDPFEYFGDPNSGFPIDEHWFWKAKGNESGKPEDDAPDWTSVAMPPFSKQECTLPHTDVFWRSSFDPSNWLQANAGKDIYLVCNINSRGWKEYHVWLNETDLGTFKSEINPYAGPIVVKVTGVVKSGDNSLVLTVPDGHIMGPVFLTSDVPQAYPYLGKQRNAQYVDIMKWRLYELNNKQDEVMAYARSIDPDRPLQISPTSTEVQDGQSDSLGRFGGSMECSGYDSLFFPLFSRLGYAGGFYGSCEPAGLPGNHRYQNTPEITDIWTTTMKKVLGWALFNGEGSVQYFWRDPCNYFDWEKQTGFLTQNLRNLSLIGKYLPQKPDIAVFLSSESALLNPYELYSYGLANIGRSELEEAHYDNVFVTETMLAKGMADDYPVLFDTDTKFMSQDTIDAIRKYVEGGGTFVAWENSGRHSLLEADAWPISELTGFKVLSVGEKGKIKFEMNLPIFKGWEGQEFEGEGSTRDFKNNPALNGVNVSLEPMTNDAVALARWEDGTVAVGMRKLGKGNVIILGSTFWRHDSDIHGNGILETESGEMAFFDRLFTDLGVKRTADASSKDVFARKMITKNGLQEWLVTMNETNSATTADAGFATDEEPAEVWDMIDQQPVPFTYEDGWVKIKDIAFDPWGTKIFGVKRATLSEGVDFWWREKTKFWRRVSAVPPLVETVQNNQEDPPTLQFPTWKFMADQDNSISSTEDWLQPAYQDNAWRNLGYEAWNFKFEDLKDYGGVGLYRSEPFAIPASWKDKRLTLNAEGYYRNLGYCFQSAEFFLNGKEVAEFPKPYRQVDITDQLQKDGNILCIKLMGNKTSGDFPLSGLLDCLVWIEPEIQLQNVISLAGQWQAVMPGWSDTQPVTLPGQASGNHFFQDVDIPSDWQGKSIYIHLKNPPDLHPPVCGMGQNSLLIVNGQPITVFYYIHKAFALDDTVNLTPYLKCGQKNRIELWPKEQTDPAAEYNFSLETIELGCEMK